MATKSTNKATPVIVDNNNNEKGEKDAIAISIIGHVDSGKSTLTGQLATKLGCLSKRDLEKLEKEAEEFNKRSFGFAFFTDKTKEERERGVTINTTLVKMATEKFDINILDCPGHANYVKNATSGCKQSDLSIEVVPARFEASVSSEGTLWTHLTLSAILGSKRFIVCINKLDTVTITDSNSLKTAFDAAKSAVQIFLSRLGVMEKDVIYLPISAFKRIGLFSGEETFDFHEGSEMPSKEEKGNTVKIKTLEDAINYQDAPERPINKKLRMPISNVARVPGHGIVLCGRVDTGKLVPE